MKKKINLQELITCPKKWGNFIARYKEYKFINYVEAYNSYLNKNFKNFKEAFDPYTKGDIGILVPKDLTSSTGGYALFPLHSSSHEKIIKDNNVIHFLSDHAEDIFFQYEAKTLHGSYESLLSKNTEELVENSVYKQLKKIVEKGELNESKCSILLIEKMVNILYFYHEDLGYDYKIEDFHYPRYSKMYPIELGEISERIYKFYAKYYFKEKYIRELIKSNRTQFKNNRYFFQLDENDWKNINEKINYAIKNKISIPEPQVSGDFPPFVALNKIINQLQDIGFKSIDNHYLPDPDNQISKVYSEIKKREGRKSWIPDIISAQFNENQAKNYIKEFFKNLETAYKELVEYCFPTLKNSFYFYSTMPHKFLVYMKDSKNIHMHGFGYGAANNNELEVHFFDRSFSDIDFSREDIEIFRGSTFSNLLRKISPIKTVNNIDTSKVDEYCVLRNWVYELIQDDIKRIMREKDIADF